MEFMGILAEVFRWAHILAGVMAFGVGYFFTFVYMPFAPTMDDATRKRVMPGMLPPGLYLARWAALWAWITGVVLMMLVFYHGGLMFDAGTDAGWNLVSIVMLAVVYVLGFAIYEGLARSPLANNQIGFAAVGFILIAVTAYVMKEVAGFSYRAYVIHTGAMLGTIMVANVWMSIWPVQRKVIAAVKAGTPPDMAAFGKAMIRAKHNIYISVPLLYTMVSLHTSVTSAANSLMYLLGAILVGWLVVWYLYRLSAKLRASNA